MPARLRIGVNALYLIPGGVGGTEIYLRNLLHALGEIDRRNHYEIYLNRETDTDLCPRAANFAPVETGVQAAFRPGRLLWEQLGLPWETMQAKLDVLFSPGFTSPRFCRGAKVTVIHDLQHKRQPKNFGFFERLAWNQAVGQSARSSTRIITVSESAKRDILAAYRLPADRVVAIPHGVEPDFRDLGENPAYPSSLPAEAGLPPQARYLLAVSTIHPHKNWRRLIGAFERLRRDEPDLRLAVCGLRGKATKMLLRILDDSPAGEAVHVLGWLPRKLLVGLFKYAEALVFPSTFEGFGMPVAEALAAGLPVACSDIAPLREVAGGCAVFFDPTSEAEMASAIHKVLHDQSIKKENICKGLARARAFRWEQAAERTLAVFLEAARR